MEEWRIYGKKADFGAIAQKFGISPMLARIIRNRDVQGDEAVDLYLNGSLSQLHDPYLLKDMGKACEILEDKIRKGAKIRVAGDYDCDGVTATYILLTALKKLGAEADFVIPNRVRDGYGLNENIVRRAAQESVDTLLTCDNGIAAREQIRLAKKMGMTVIVTDHHEVPEEGAPVADAVVNPKQPDCGYPFKGLCGAAIAWKLAQVLYRRNQIPEEELYGLLEIVALATVADVMALQGENRILVKEGLARMRETQNLGLAALIEANGIHRESLSSYHLGFILGPCLNASGRLETAVLSLELLQSKNREEAERIAGKLKELNETRKDMTQKGVAKAIEMIESQGKAPDPVMVVYLPECHESIAGIIAGRIREKYNHPVFVLTDSQDGAKGSGRSIEAYHMYQGLCGASAYLEQFGGHPMAAGLSIKKENIGAFRKCLNANAALSEKDFTKKVWLDMELPFSYINEAFVEELKRLEPFGNGNPKPLFGASRCQIRKGRVIGRNRNVLRLSLTDKEGTEMEAVWFGDTGEFKEKLSEKYGKGQVENMLRGYENHIRLTIAYYPSANEYAGRKSLQIIIENYIA